MIILDDKYSIKADPNNFTLVETTINQDEKSKNYGEKQERIMGYYPTVQSALYGLSKMLMKEKTIKKDMKLDEAIEEFRKIEEQYLGKIKY